MKKALGALALLVISVGVCALVGEIGVRLFYSRIADYNLEMWRYASAIKERNSNPTLPFAHAANRVGNFYGAEIKTNAFGFRDNEYAVQRTAGRKRIVMLGDSFTLGWGVPFNDIYAKQLEALLAANGQPTDVINLGVGNFNTVMEVELFRQKGLQFQPDAVVLMYYINDAEPTPAVVNPIRASVLTRSYLLAFISDRYIRLKPLINKDYDWKAYYANLYLPGAAGAQASRQALIDLAALCRERNIKLLIVNIPELRELKEYPFPAATEFVRSVAADRDVPFLDLRPALVAEDPATLWVTPADPHANSKANGLIARALFDGVLHTDLLGTRPAPTPAKGRPH